MSILEELLVQKVVCIQDCLLTADQDDLSLFSQLLVLKASNELYSGLLIAFERTNDIMMHRLIEPVHKFGLLLFKFKLLDCRNVLEVENDTFFVIKRELRSLDDKCPV